MVFCYVNTYRPYTLPTLIEIAYNVTWLGLNTRKSQLKKAEV